MTALPSFGAWLKQRRKALGLTQRELGRQAGCAEVTVRKIEAGDLHPSAQMVTRLAACLGVAEGDLPEFAEVALGHRAGTLPLPERARARPPHNLPAQLTPLFGRERDIATLRRWVLEDGARLVTLVGPPGTGKTRLAQTVAAGLGDQFENGVFFVALAPVLDPAQIPSTMAQDLGLQLRGINPSVVELRAFLEEKHLLLVLDNFEQVVEAAPLVVGLLQHCLWLHILVTSRQPLRVRGERQYVVHPLAVPPDPGRGGLRSEPADLMRFPAVALFVDRAQAVAPDFQLDLSNASAVAELCRRLDGLPLAIELIAARVKLFPPPTLLARLTGPLLLSADGLRDVEPRQKTLRAAIEWSFNLLSPLEQTLFARLSVFKGGCTLEAAQAVCAWPSSDLPLSSSDVLAGLLEKSLVVRQAGAAGEPRYALLETVADYAMERLEADGQVEEACHHHLAWCLALAEAVSPPPFGIFRQVNYAQLDAEIHNLRAGLAWAFQCDSHAALQLVRATSHYLTHRGYVDEARYWLNQALDLPEAAGFTLQRAELLFERGAVEHVAVDLAAVEALMTETLAISRDLGLVLGEAGAMYYLGRVAAVSGDIGRAEACLEAAAAAYHAVGDAIEGYNILSVLAEMVMFRGDLQRSRELHQQALALHLPASHRHLQIYSLGGLAELAQVEGDQAEAKRLAEQFLAASRERGNPAEIAWALTCLGEIAIRRGDLSIALVHLNEALVVGRQGDAAWRVPIVLGTLGDLAVATGEFELALRHYQESLPALAERGIYEVPQGSLRLAVLASAGGGHILAATLLSACAGTVEAGITVFFPVTKADYDRAVATTRAALDLPDFDRAWALGQTLMPQTAVAYGLQQLRAWGAAT